MVQKKLNLLLRLVLKPKYILNIYYQISFGNTFKIMLKSTERKEMGSDMAWLQATT